MNDFLTIMETRGFVHQHTNLEALKAAFKAGRVSAYIGFDCTAPSLHVGSLMQIMVLRWLQKTGHQPIALLGGGTTRVGDPSGKDETRKLLTSEDISKNLKGIERTLSAFLKFGPREALLVNNDEWLAKLNYIDFLRHVGRFFSVNRMLSQDSVKLRLEREQNLSFLEFNYMVLQAYDFVELQKRYGCVLQIGGSDQWGNIVMGIELARKISAEKRIQPLPLSALTGASMHAVQPMINSKTSDSRAYEGATFANALNGEQAGELFGMTTPLLTTSSGAKMGKTAEGAVWLSDDMLSPYHYWQYWRNTEDADVVRFLKLFTELPLAEIEKLGALQGAEINEAKKILASEATTLAHGVKAAKAAEEAAAAAFSGEGVETNLPTITLDPQAIGKGAPAYELFRIAGLAPSGGEAKRLIRGGGARVNDRRITDEAELFTPDHFQEPLKLTAGKKRHVRVVLGA